MRVRSVSIQEWQEFVESLPDYSFFQLPIWAQAYEKTYPNCKIATKLFTFDDGTQVLVPLVEMKGKFGFKAYESLPAGGYGGFLWNRKPNKKQMKQILKYFLNRRVLRLAIYPNPRDWRNFQFLEDNSFKSKEVFTHILELDADYDWVWKNRINGKNRNQTRKALKSGVKIVLANNPEQIKAYYQLYLNSVHRWRLQNNSIRPLHFFENLFKLGSNSVKYYLAKYDKNYIAGVIVLYGSESCFYWASAMQKDYAQYCPNNLLLNKVIEDACKNLYRFLNMGASLGLPGVQMFKESFGAKRLDYKYFVYENPFLKIYRKAKSVLRFMKRTYN